MTVRRLRSFLALVVLAASGCRPSGAPSAAGTDATAADPVAATVTRTDALGRAVRVPVRPQRIVSLAPALTETLFAVGADAQVVGVTRYCNHPAEAAGRTVVGGFADPDVERVVALRPDLVLATADTVSRERFDAMVALGIPAFAVDARDLEGVASSIESIGTLTAHGDAGEAEAAAFRSRIDSIAKRIEGRKRPRVLFLFDTAPPIAAGPDTFVDGLLARAGAENVAASAPTSYPRYGVEGILAAAPDVILTTAPDGEARLRTMLPGMKAAIHRLDPDLLERPGPRLAEGLELLARLLHPEAFADAP